MVKQMLDCHPERSEGSRSTQDVLMKSRDGSETHPYSTLLTMNEVHRFKVSQ